MAGYQAYMLRVWYEDEEIRIILESADGGRQKGFGSLAAMIGFLCKRGDELGSARVENGSNSRIGACSIYPDLKLVAGRSEVETGIEIM